MDHDLYLYANLADPKGKVSAQARRGSVAGVVGVAGEDGCGAIELLGEDQSGDGMGEGEGAQGENQSSAKESVGRPPIGWTDGENDMLGALLTLGTEPRSE
jgi:hypothetical protein